MMRRVPWIAFVLMGGLAVTARAAPAETGAARWRYVVSIGRDLVGFQDSPLFVWDYHESADLSVAREGPATAQPEAKLLWQRVRNIDTGRDFAPRLGPADRRGDVMAAAVGVRFIAPDHRASIGIFPALFVLSWSGGGLSSHIWATQGGGIVDARVHFRPNARLLIEPGLSVIQSATLLRADAHNFGNVSVFRTSIGVGF